MRTRYDVNLTLDRIELVDKYNASQYVNNLLFYDSLYTHVLKSWFNMLGITNANTKAISDPMFVKEMMTKHEADRSKYTHLFVLGDQLPELINCAIDKVCESYGFCAATMVA